MCLLGLKFYLGQSLCNCGQVIQPHCAPISSSQKRCYNNNTYEAVGRLNDDRGRIWNSAQHIVSPSKRLSFTDSPLIHVRCSQVSVKKLPLYSPSWLSSVDRASDCGPMGPGPNSGQRHIPLLWALSLPLSLKTDGKISYVRIKKQKSLYNLSLQVL